MIKEKHKWYISIVSMVLAIMFVISVVFINSKGMATADRVQATNLDTVLDKDNITEVNIDMDETDWKWLIENATDEEFRSCNITINGETFNNVGIRGKGNSSLNSVSRSSSPERYSFKIRFDKYVDGQTYKGIKSIVLNNIIQDNTSMKEYITYDLYKSLGVATPEMSYSNLKINNEMWGLYLALEVVDERFLENNFGTTKGNLYKPETMGVGGGDGGNQPPRDENHQGPGAGGPPERNNMKGQGEQTPSTENIPNQQGNPESETLDKNSQWAGNGEINNENAETIKNQGKGRFGSNPGGGRNVKGADFVYVDDEVSSYSTVRESAMFKSTTDKDFKRVINMYKNLNEGTNLEEVLDVKEVLKYFAVNAFVINLDSYSGAMYHNYYLYENKGQSQILPWDLNLSFGGFSARGASGSSNTINFPIDNPVTGNLEDMPLIGKLLEVDEYKELYHSYLKQIADEYFKSGKYSNVVKKVDTLINNYVKEDPTAFCTYEEYETAVAEMIKFGEDRTKSVLAQLNGEQPSTTYGDLTSTVNMSVMGDGGGGGERQEAQAKTTNQDINTNETEKSQDNKVSNTKNNESDSTTTVNASTKGNIDSKEKIVEQKNLMARPQSNSNDKQNIAYLGLMGGFTIIGLGALLFIFKFKRKKRLK